MGWFDTSESILEVEIKETVRNGYELQMQADALLNEQLPVRIQPAGAQSL